MRIRYRVQTRVTVRREIRYRATYRVQPTYESVVQPPPRPTASLPARTVTRVIRTTDGVAGSEMLHVQPASPERAWDVFICHASEDKPFVAELAAELEDLGIKAWLDAVIIRVGDSIRQQIDYGLAHSRFGVAVLSHDFFAKKKRWTALELDALVALEASGRQRILPIWHGLTTEDILGYSPVLAGKAAARTSDATVRAVAEAIAEVIRTAS